jgi:hypothetical protein
VAGSYWAAYDAVGGEERGAWVRVLFFFFCSCLISVLLSCSCRRKTIPTVLIQANRVEALRSTRMARRTMIQELIWTQAWKIWMRRARRGQRVKRRMRMIQRMISKRGQAMLDTPRPSRQKNDKIIGGIDTSWYVCIRDLRLQIYIIHK